MEPYFEEWELKDRQSVFDRAFNIREAVYTVHCTYTVYCVHILQAWPSSILLIIAGKIYVALLCCINLNFKVCCAVL